MIKRATVVAGLLLATAAVVALVLFAFPEAEDESAPYPNGYDDLLAAGQMISGEPPERKDPIEEFRDYVSTNRAALDRARAGLARQCQFPRLGVSEEQHDRQVDGFKALRELGLAFGVEGHLAAQENRLDDAVRYYLDRMKLGVIVAHGGVMIEALVTIAVAGQAPIDLNAIVSRLNLGQCRALLGELEKMKQEQETTATILQRETKWQKRQLLAVDGFKEYLHEAWEAKSLDPYAGLRKTCVKQFDQFLQTETDLKARVAARTFLLATGHSAKSWNDLVPVYLKTAPKVTFLPSDVDK